MILANRNKKLKIKFFEWGVVFLRIYEQIKHVSCQNIKYKQRN